MENPLELPAPDDPIERIHEFARDLVWGAVNGNWTANLVFKNGETLLPNIASKLEKKWGDKYPPVPLLVSFEYLAPDDRSNFRSPPGQLHGATTIPVRSYFLTAKAFSLLQRPLIPVNIFVSYKRDESSALGLLIEARLKLVDKNISVFIDKLLEPGDKWHAQLEEKVRQSRFFVCLLGPKSLGSRYVRNEIRWALDEAAKSDTIIIPVCHNGYYVGAELPEEFGEDTYEIQELLNQLSINNAITINPESAEEYELAIIKVLNKLGYSNV